MIASNLENPFSFDIFRTLESQPRQHGYGVVVANTGKMGEDPPEERAANPGRPAGILLLVQNGDDAIRNFPRFCIANVTCRAEDNSGIGGEEPIGADATGPVQAAGVEVGNVRRDGEYSSNLVWLVIWQSMMSSPLSGARTSAGRRFVWVRSEKGKWRTTTSPFTNPPRRHPPRA
jgi:hypothetical protein